MLSDQKGHEGRSTGKLVNGCNSRIVHDPNYILLSSTASSSGRHKINSHEDKQEKGKHHE